MPCPRPSTLGESARRRVASSPPALRVPTPRAEDATAPPVRRRIPRAAPLPGCAPHVPTRASRQLRRSSGKVRARPARPAVGRPSADDRAARPGPGDLRALSWPFTPSAETSWHSHRGTARKSGRTEQTSRAGQRRLCTSCRSSRLAPAELQRCSSRQGAPGAAQQRRCNAKVEAIREVQTVATIRHSARTTYDGLTSIDVPDDCDVEEFRVVARRLVRHRAFDAKARPAERLWAVQQNGVATTFGAERD